MDPIAPQPIVPVLPEKSFSISDKVRWVAVIGLIASFLIWFTFVMPAPVQEHTTVVTYGDVLDVAPIIFETATNTSAWLEYKNERLGVEFKYPSSLKLMDVDDDETRLSFVSTDEGDYGYSAFVTIVLYKGDAHDYGYDGVYESVREPGDTSKEVFAPILLGGKEGYKIVKIDEYQPTSPEYAHYVVKNGQYIYEIISQDGEFEKAGVLGTFRFSDPVFSDTWRTYRNENFGLKIDFPYDWQWGDERAFTGVLGDLNNYGYISFNSPESFLERGRIYPWDIEVSVQDSPFPADSKNIPITKEIKGRKFEIGTDRDGCTYYAYSTKAQAPYSSLHNFRFSACNEEKLSILEKMLATLEFPGLSEMRLKTYRNEELGIELQLPTEWLVKEAVAKDGVHYTKIFSVPGEEEYARIFMEFGKALVIREGIEQTGKVSVSGREFTRYLDHPSDGSQIIYTLPHNGGVYIFYGDRDSRLQEMLSTLTFTK